MRKKAPHQNLPKWNDLMFKKHPTPYSGFAGLVEKFRIQTICSYANIGASDSVIELGCEAGNLLLALRQGKRMFGFDISKEALKEAGKKSKQQKREIEFVYGDLTKKLPFKKGEFSVIICSETLEHVVDPEKAIKNIYKICDSDTRLIITVPDEKPKLIIKKVLTKFKIMKVVMPGIEAEQSEWHLHAFSKGMLLNMLKKYYKIEKVGSILGLHIIVSVKIK